MIVVILVIVDKIIKILLLNKDKFNWNSLIRESKIENYLNWYILQKNNQQIIVKLKKNNPELEIIIKLKVLIIIIIKLKILNK